MFSDRKTIENLREKASILKVISNYIASIKKRGKDYVALCPFHNEKTPSFSISEEKQIFHCFGCGKGGDVFKFVSEIENINFPGALQKVALYSNFSLPKEFFTKPGFKQDFQKDKKREIEHYWSIMKQATQIFQKNLLLAEKNRSSENNGYQYLIKRGISEKNIQKAIKNFSIGYADKSWDQLMRVLGEKKITKEELFNVGLIKKNETGRMYDTFRNRLVFPIQNENGKVVAFGGRLIDEEQHPKYLNSPDSLIFKKSKLLYGLYQAAEEIRRTKRIFVMEGYLDVIASNLAGLKNVVAPMGTSLTEDHLRLLSRFSKEVYLVFDGDKAGKNATVRVSTIARNFPLDFFVLLMPPGIDPFDFFQKKDLIEFFSRAEKADNLADYEIKHYLTVICGKEGLNLAFQALNETKSVIQREKGLRIIAKILGVNEFSVKEEFSDFSKKNMNRQNFFGNSITLTEFKPSVVTGQKEVRSFLSKEPTDPLAALSADSEEKILKIMHELLLISILYPDTLENLIMDFSMDRFRSLQDRNLFMMLTDAHIDGKVINCSSLGDLNLSENLLNQIYKELISKNYSQDEEPGSIYNRFALQANICLAGEKIINVKNKITEAERKNNSSSIQSAFEELAILQHDKDKLLARLQNI